MPDVHEVSTPGSWSARRFDVDDRELLENVKNHSSLFEWCAIVRMRRMPVWDGGARPFYDRRLGRVIRNGLSSRKSSSGRRPRLYASWDHSGSRLLAPVGRQVADSCWGLVRRLLASDAPSPLDFLWNTCG